MDRESRLQALKRRACDAREKLDREAIEVAAAKAAADEARQAMLKAAADFVQRFEAVVRRINLELSPSGFKIEVKKEVKIAEAGAIEERQAQIAIHGEQGVYNTLAFAYLRTGWVQIKHFGRGSIDAETMRPRVSHEEADDAWIENALVTFCEASLP